MSAYVWKIVSSTHYTVHVRHYTNLVTCLRNSAANLTKSTQRHRFPAFDLGRKPYLLAVGESGNALSCIHTSALVRRCAWRHALQGVGVVWFSVASAGHIGSDTFSACKMRRLSLSMV